MKKEKIHSAMHPIFEANLDRVDWSSTGSSSRSIHGCHWYSIQYTRRLQLYRWEICLLISMRAMWPHDIVIRVHNNSLTISHMLHRHGQANSKRWQGKRWTCWFHEFRICATTCSCIGQCHQGFLNKNPWCHLHSPAKGQWLDPNDWDNLSQFWFFVINIVTRQFVLAQTRSVTPTWEGVFFITCRPGLWHPPGRGSFLKFADRVCGTHLDRGSAAPSWKRVCHTHLRIFLFKQTHPLGMGW